MVASYLYPQMFGKGFPHATFLAAEGLQTEVWLCHGMRVAECLRVQKQHDLIQQVLEIAHKLRLLAKAATKPQQTAFNKRDLHKSWRITGF